MYIMVIGIIYLLVRIIKSKESLLYKLIISFAILVVFIFCFVNFIVSGWESGRNQKEPAIKLEYFPKTIYD